MVIATLATTIIFMGIFILVICYGYNSQLRAMRMEANVNAGLWAEAEAKAHNAEIQVARLDAALKTRIQLYMDMHRIAREAIEAAGQRVDILPLESAEELDEVLDATEIDN